MLLKRLYNNIRIDTEYLEEGVYFVSISRNKTELYNRIKKA